MKRLGVGFSLLLLIAAACTDDAGDDGMAPTDGGDGGTSTTGGTAPRAGGSVGGAPTATGGAPDEPQGGTVAGPVGGEPGNGGQSITGGTGTGEAGAAHGGVGGAPPEPMSGPVQGVVLAGTVPLTAVTVVLGDSSTITDANGTFSFDDAPSNYQLIVISTSDKLAIVIDGMASRNPTVQLPIVSPATRQTSIRASVLGDTGPYPSVYETRLVFVSDDDRILGNTTFGPAWHSFQIIPRWAGATTISGTLWALVVNSNGSPYLSGIASKQLTLQNGVSIEPDYDAGFGGQGGAPAVEEPVSAADLTLTPIDERIFECDVELPENYFGVPTTVLGPFGYSMGYGPDPQPPYDCVVPVGTGLPLSAVLRAGNNPAIDPLLVGSVVSMPVPDTGDMAFHVDAGARPLLPINGATGVTTATEFSWSDPPEGTVARAWFSVGGWKLQRITTERKTTLPDLGPYGVPLPKNAAGAWSVTSRGPAATVDQVVALYDISTSGILRDPLVVGPTYSFSYSGSQSFTTAP